MPPQTSSPYVTASFLLQLTIAALISLAAYFTQSTVSRVDDSLRHLNSRMAEIEATHAKLEQIIATLPIEPAVHLWRPTQPPVNQRRNIQP